MAARLRSVVEFVADMDQAIRFYGDTLGLPVRSRSPERTEFQTGDVTLVLRPASEENPPGALRLAFGAAGLAAEYHGLVQRGVRFTRPPTREQGGPLTAEFLDSEDARCTIGEASGDS